MSSTIIATLNAIEQLLRQFVQECITGTGVADSGPKLGPALLCVLDQLEEESSHLDKKLDKKRDALHERTIETDRQIEAMQAEIHDIIKRQRETIEALIEENEDLRAKLALLDHTSWLSR
jgi:vacuolar-type H+-ATPase subunit I/STV1